MGRRLSASWPQSTTTEPQAGVIPACPAQIIALLREQLADSHAFVGSRYLRPVSSFRCNSGDALAVCRRSSSKLCCDS
jgi:hypothetical protein